MGLADYIGLDPDKPLRQQEAFGGGTWAQYFEEEAITWLMEIVAQSEAARREGVKLTDEDLEMLDAAVEYLVYVAGENGQSPDRFLRDNYGRGMSLDRYRSILERMLLSDMYEKHTIEMFGFTDDDFEAFYTANRVSYDFLDYHIFALSGLPADLNDREQEYTEEELEAFREEQKRRAEEMRSRVTTSDAFFALSLEYTDTEEETDHDDHDGHDHDDDDDEEPEDTTLKIKQAAGSLNEVISDYLLDDSRRAGDTAVIEDEDEFLVLLFLDRYRDESPFTEEEVIARAESIYAEWLAGDADEDSFAELARRHSADGNSDRGGIYVGVRQGQMVAPFNDWIFDEERQPGDSGIVETQFGQHIMYFIGVSEEDLTTVDIRHILIQAGGWKAAVKAAMDKEFYEDHRDDLLDELSFKRHWFGMWFTKTKSA
jgi:hypothetical protein